MTHSLVLTELQENAALLTLNRPEALNALSTEMRAAIVAAVNDLAADDRVKCVVMTGNGRAFCAGLDLKEIGSSTDEIQEESADTNLVRAFNNLNKPLIGAINGFAITGGFELALMSDFLIASENAKFADTHSRIGIVPGWGLSQKLPRLVGINRAKQLSFTGNFLDADTAERWGLVNQIVPAEELVSFCMQMANEIASCEPVTLNTVKTIIDQGWDTTLAEGLRIETKANKAHMQDVTPEQLEERRKGVMNRGREQNP